MEKKEDKILEKFNDKAFISYVSLSNGEFDKEDILLNLKYNFAIYINHDLPYYKEMENALIFQIGENLCVIEYKNEPYHTGVSDKIFYKKYQYYDEIIENYKNHSAHIFIYVSCSDSLVMSALLHTKITHAVAKRSSSISVLSYSDIYEKSHYIEEASLMKEDILPVRLWVKSFFVQVGSEKIANTVGMHNFLHLDFEISNVEKYAQEDVTFLLDNLIYYTIDNNIDFLDGHTFSLSSIKHKFDRIKIQVGRSDYFDIERIVKIRL